MKKLPEIISWGTREQWRGSFSQEIETEAAK
jgi:hypothetical protein